MNYKRTYTPKKGYTPLCYKGVTTFKDLEFGMLELGPGESYTFKTEEREAAFILLGGIADFKFNGGEYKKVGGRRTVFEGKAHTVYMPRHQEVTVYSPWNVKIAVCTAAAEKDTEPAYIKPEDCPILHLGQTSWKRDAQVMIDSKVALHLNVGEAFIVPGNWAGFPPHKHDTSNMPAEDIQEELYYFLFQPSQGFAVQCMYTKDGEMNEAYMVKNDELVEFPYGYHTTVAAPGYNSYFLYVTSAEHPGMFRSIDPDHEWVSAVENVLSKK